MINNNILETKLNEILQADKILKEADMSKEVSFKAGGKADFLVKPAKIEELRNILEILEEEKIPHIVMGNGSNLLIKDGGFRGVIVKIAGEDFTYMVLNEEAESKNDEVYVKVGAGILMSTFARFLCEHSLTGFEFASGIPGSIGGAVFMNAGAYGGEIKDIIEYATVISKDGKEIKKLSKEELDLSYRHSILHNTGDIVIDVTFRLKKGIKEEIEKEIKELSKKRNEKQPVNYPSAGSFFKRPEGYFAGKLIQDAGLKGFSVGGAEVSTLHSGFVINKGNATATDIVKLMKHCQSEVERQFGVKLEPEVRILGED